MTQKAKKAELLIVQRELADEKDYPPDGLWETLDGFCCDEQDAAAVIAGERAKQLSLDTSDDQVFRVVKLVGEVVAINRPKSEDDE